ncbi:MAG: DUF4166 domain-containing protein [Pseudomonadota bacterium]
MKSHILARSDAFRDLHSGVRQAELTGLPIYRQVMGAVFDRLPPKVRALHDSTEERVWRGTAKVERGKGVLNRLVARIFGFPEGTEKTDVEVRFSPEGDSEVWTRTFGTKQFRSVQRVVQRREAFVIVERFGWIDIALALAVEDDRLMIVPRHWRVLGIPLPKFLMPGGSTYETDLNGRFHFNVEITAPLLGLIVSYRGELGPA